jgi:hypothetical protein
VTAEGLARIQAARTTHGMRTAEMEQMRKLVRALRAGAKRLVEMTWLGGQSYGRGI